MAGHTADHGAIVIGAGHNGLITAAYLARAGIDTLLVEARETVGGCASTVDWSGARVNICNCDHVVFRTTPVMEELGLADHGLRYLETDPAQINASWAGGPAWPMFTSPERTLESLRRFHPGEVEGYRRYLKAAVPAAELVLEVANEPPTARGIARRLLERRGRGAATMLAWSRRSVADVLRSYFSAEALVGPAVTTGPAVWGLSPFTPRTGMGAIVYALKHAGRPGRPEGGSGSVPTAVLSAFTAAGGTLRTGSKVAGILCEGERVRGVELTDGTVIEAPVVVCAADPREAFVRWLRNPPTAAADMVRRWRDAPAHPGYESKIDAVVDEAPRLTMVDAAAMADLGVDDASMPTTIVAPPVDEIARMHGLIGEGRVGERPMFYVQTPSVLDPTMRPTPDTHVFSLEVLFTPYALTGGWADSHEPARWLDTLATIAHPGWRDGVHRFRAMTPAAYETEFFMPQGHATSFAGGPLAALRNANPELTRYETPVRGLYLTGAATFPGAGVWGASGRNCATVVLRG